MTKIEAVVVTYGAAEYSLACLRSLSDHLPRPSRIHVVDNNSPDDTADRIATEFPNVHLVRNPENSGFSVANNIILRGLDSPFVLLLNPDARIEAGTIQVLLEFMESEPEVGVVGCRLLTADGDLDHAAKRHIPNAAEAVRYFVGKGLVRQRSRYTAPEIDEREIADVGAVNGAFMLVRTEAMRQVGLLDEQYWMYAEDLDWCVRFRKAGWRVVYNGSVTAHHAKGGSAGVRSIRLNYHFHRSMAIFYRRHVAESALGQFVGVGAIWTLFVVTACRNAIKRRFGGRGRVDV